MSDDKSTNAHPAGEEPPADEPPKSIRLNYIKSQFFRVVHTDGAIGGITPHLEIHMDCWSQRGAIPQETVHEVLLDGTLGKEIRPERKTREGIVREVEVGLVFNVEVAKELIKWLQNKVDRIAEFTEKTIDESNSSNS